LRFQRTLTGGGELLALLRPLWCFIAGSLFRPGCWTVAAWAAPAPAITTLPVISRGNAVTTLAQGSVITLTATVMTGGTPVMPGRGNFCDATAKFCTDIHLLGATQLTTNGKATLKFRPGVGNHSYGSAAIGLRPMPSRSGTSTETASWI
jgi:hypothetical protein